MYQSLVKNHGFKSLLKSNVKVAIVQMLVGHDKEQNLQSATRKVTEAAEHGADFVILPECFNSPYGTLFFEKYAERIPGGSTLDALSKVAKTNKVWLVGGTIPEIDENDKIYNTCTIFSPQGELVKKYRKIHLFDIDIPGKITFKESDTLSAGDEFCTFQVGEFKVGIGICYDLRFPEFTSVLTQKGCNLLIFPSAFNTTTGPLHWHILQRGRAIDSQAYIITASPARNPNSNYQAYGHSMVVAPMGHIIIEAGEGEEIIYTELNSNDPLEMRRNIPALKQKRSDIYSLPREVAVLEQQ